MSAYSFWSMVEVIKMLKLKPVFVGIDPETYNITPFEIEKKNNKKNKSNFSSTHFW